MIHDRNWPQYETARRQTGGRNSSGPAGCSSSGLLSRPLVWGGGNYLEAMVRYRRGVPWLTEDPPAQDRLATYGVKD